MRTTVPPKIDASSLKLASMRAPASLPTPAVSLALSSLLELARRHNLHRANPLPLLHLRAPGRDHFAHLADAVVVDQHRQQVAQFLLKPSLAFNLSSIATFCVAAIAGFTKSSRNSALPSRWRENRSTAGQARLCPASAGPPHRQRRWRNALQRLPSTFALPWRSGAATRRRGIRRSARGRSPA